MNEEQKSNTVFTLFIIGVIVFIILFLFGLVWGWKSFRVWSAGQDGKAKLAEAVYSKQVQLEEAKANLEAQKLNAQAEVERAKGAAQAIKIEGGQLSERYIQYLYVQNLEKLDTQLIYVPTEGGLPLLEAGRLGQGE